ncbi:MAG: exosortase-associated EpsI family protein [Verrucomicrobiales bacterium]
MKKSSLIILIGFGIMLGMATLVLHRAQTNQKIGKPGVMVGNDPIYNDANEFVTNSSVALPKDVPGYQSVAQPITKMELQWLPPDTVYGRREYRAEDGFAAQLSVVLMGKDRTSIHKPQYCLNGSGWKIVNSEVVDIPMSKPSPYPLKAMKLTTYAEIPVGNGQKIPRSGLYIYWFVADDQLTPHHGERMWWMARDMLTKGVLQRWAYIANFSTCAPGQEDQLFKQMQDFITKVTPEFQLASGVAESTAAVDGGGAVEVAASK